MVLTSAVIGKVQKIEQRILHSLEHPSSDGYMPNPVEKHITEFQEIRLSHLAASILEPRHTLNQAAYADFVSEVLVHFSQFEVSRANLHYCCDYVSDCATYLKHRLLEAWDEMSGVTFLKNLGESMRSPADINFTALLCSAQKCSQPEDTTQIQHQLLQLKQVYASQMMDKLKIGLEEIANIERVLLE